ncbi:MAG: hypothetical protein IJA53_12695 [Spirochaetaceae bacterium]|nr:hypothetical protein [Spirochaetaceae bacterium]
MKKIFSLVVSLIMAFSLYAQNVKSVGLSDSDVKNWAKNLNPIVKELQVLGVWTNDSINASANQKLKVDDVLNKYGISGSNCIEKFGVISECAVVVVAASELDAQSAALLKAMGMDPLAELKKNINSKDYAVVEANAKAVIEAYNNLDTSSFEYEASAASAGDDYSYGDDDLSYGDEDLADFYSRLAKSAENVASQSSNLDMKEANEEGQYVKSMYEAISKASGDSGLLYKSSKQASKYKKTSYKEGTIVKIDYNWDTEDKNQSKYVLIFDLDKKTAEFNFDWKVAKVDYSDFLNGYSVESTTKSLKYTITSVEYYYLTEDIGRSYGEGMEYVIKTKEGLVLHAWKQYDGDYNAFQMNIGIKGLPDSLTETLDWTTE